MQVIDLEKLPVLLRLPLAEKVSGLSRSEIYRRLRSGKLQGKKAARTTFVVTASLLAMLDELPDWR